MLVLITEAMVFLHSVRLVGQFAHSLWPATMFRDDQAAVELGNGCPTGTFRGIWQENRLLFALKLLRLCRLDGGCFLNFRPKKNIFQAKEKYPLEQDERLDGRSARRLAAQA
jgi:hypothetical protein